MVWKHQPDAGLGVCVSVYTHVLDLMEIQQGLVAHNTNDKCFPSLNTISMSNPMVTRVWVRDML